MSTSINTSISSVQANSKFRQVAIQAAKEAGGIVKRDFHRKKHVSLKKDLSFVTETDLAAEQAILKIIKKNFPSHAVLSEESGGNMGDEYTWLIDPLDGTTNFVRGTPLFSVCIALLYQKKPIIAAVYNPIANELYTAQRGRGAFLNNKKIHVSTFRDLRRAILAYNFGRGAQNTILLLDIMRKLAGKIKSLRIFASSNLQLCYVAAGRIDGYITLMSSPWDLLPGALIAEEAGAMITARDGSPLTHESGGLVSANSYLHAQLLHVLYGKGTQN